MFDNCSLCNTKGRQSKFSVLTYILLKAVVGIFFCFWCNTFSFLSSFVIHYWSKDKLMATFSKENNII